MTDDTLDARILERLFAVIESRKGTDPSTSYTAKLFGKGHRKIAQKFGEEAIETVIEAVNGDEAALAEESADLLYHLLVLWSSRGLRPQEVWMRLAARSRTSGLVEKAGRRI